MKFATVILHVHKNA